MPTPAPMFADRSLILAKIETTFNTDAVPVQGTDAVLVTDLNIQMNPTKLDRNLMRAVLSASPIRVGRMPVTITFTHELRGATAVAPVIGTPPKLGTLLRACGCALTWAAGPSPALGHYYDPVDSAFDSITIYAYRDGILHKILGSRGSAVITGEAGNYGKVAFTFQGSYVAVTDVTLPASPVFETTDPPIIESVALTVGAMGDFATQSFTLDFGVTTALRENMNKPEGYEGNLITMRSASAKINPELTRVADFDFWTKLKASTQQAVTLTVGSATGNRCVITLPNAQFSNVNYGERSKVLVAECDLHLPQPFNSSTKEFQLAFT